MLFRPVDPIIKLTAGPHPFRIQRFESKRKNEAPAQDGPNKVNLGISDIPSQTPEKLDPVKGTCFKPVHKWFGTSRAFRAAKSQIRREAGVLTPA